MKKVYLNEEQFKEYIRYTLEESFISEKGSNPVLRDRMNAVVNHINDRARQGDAGLIQKAKENGINIDSLKGNLSSDEYNTQFTKQVNDLLAQKNEAINGWIHQYLPLLRQCYIGKTFRTGKESVLHKDGALARDAQGNIQNATTVNFFDKLDNEQKKEVYALREFLDKEGLTFIYREATKPSSFSIRYNIDIPNVDWNTPVGEINFDFGKLSDSEIKDYYTGTRVAWINKKLEDLGYSLNGNEKKFQVGSDAWNGSDGKEGVADVAGRGKLEMVAARYVQRRYGMEFNFGGEMFSFGNAKINNDTLIVNFTAAMRCPAWNECLLKDACYARNTERGYDNTLNRNLKTNLIWEQTKEDSELMELMLQLVRAYMVNYSVLAKELKNFTEPSLFDGLWEGKSNNYNAVDPIELCKMSFSEIQSKYGEEAIKSLSDNKYGKIIRLNEDGDFIGQWLVDAWDKWAGDFKLVGINVAAYTCRALNYEKVKNLILNISQEALVKGQNSTAFAHYFYAVEPETYDSLNETYNGRDYKLFINQKTGKITPIYRKLIEKDGTLVGYYYKCPCGRGKFVYQEIPESEISNKIAKEAVDTAKIDDAREDSPSYVRFNGKYYIKTKNSNLEEKADCYRCRICYGRDSEERVMTEDGQLPQQGLPVYVFVSAHGANKDELGNTSVRKVQGHTAEEWAQMQKEQIAATDSAAMMEDNETIENDPLAIQQITKNTIESVASMMSSKGNALMEAKKQFFNIFDKIN